MCRPFRLYCFHLAQKLGRTLKEIQELSNNEISEWMAFELTQNPEWKIKYNEELEKNRQSNLTMEQKAKLFNQMIGGNR